MNFYERYEKLCHDRGIKPISERAAQAIGVKRATITNWKQKGTTPKAETVARVAEEYGVSQEYLLGRTDDPTNYSDYDLIAETRGAALDELEGDMKKATAFQRAAAEDVSKENDEVNHFMKSVYQRLDTVDRAKVEAYAQGLLEQEKYNKRSLKLQDA